MPLGLANEIWSELRSYLSSVDRQDAAETVVNVLIENGYDAVDIRDAFKGDREIKGALAQYLEPEQDEDEEDEDYDEYIDTDDY